MEDIADEVGVSINTVSRALNDKPDVNDQTKREILQKAEDLNYQPNRFAKGLRKSKTSTIGVIVADILNPFFAGVLKGVEKTARRENYSIIVQDTSENYENEMSAIQTMLGEQVDGLLITPVQTERDSIKHLQKSGLPFVLLGRFFEELETNYVVTDDVKGAYKVIEHLIGRGHEIISMINGPSHISSSKERFLGFKKSMKKHNLEVFDSLIFNDVFTMDQGYNTAKEIIKTSPKPTAVFCYSDFVALGVLKATRDLGLTVPEDLAVVGYDDIFFSDSLDVPLTTVKIPKKELGMRSFKLLNELINNGSSQTIEEIKLETKLKIRKSA